MIGKKIYFEGKIMKNKPNPFIQGLPLGEEIPEDQLLKSLIKYKEMLETWQEKINLVSSSTLPHAWERHFKDSLQLLAFLPPQKATLVDLGSGAGFPGLVLAIVRPQTLDVTLIESDLRKCLFLENVSRETFSRVTILRSRIESIKNMIQYDVVTARGFAPLSLLLDYSFPLMKKKGVGIFLKGKKAEEEILEAQKKWDFDLEIRPSLTDSQGRILIIKNLKRISSDD
jgi:16S rRNA (guanine527-N7)-methyltransferase